MDGGVLNMQWDLYRWNGQALAILCTDGLTPVFLHAIEIPTIYQQENSWPWHDALERIPKFPLKL